ncbi:hypothetical protein F9C07_2107361 [Aspergillus flavus]|uniref:Uncharacterized protein n=1 Tax=Aspergillus flavus (strain ATCC 200026 / FGSC A1120 / IAM 13836 / NRRL 3357 / JCM 12722 / SRRC 167) TaxID=332952 RepID=A0A7U2QSL2_ASPFN|nr:hypothetical protein F9C07_2107361 [Aspergillus flavus]
MAVSYMFQFLDKFAKRLTSILGLTDDQHLQGEDYSWASRVYYFGYLAAFYVAAVLLARFSVGKMISASICVLVSSFPYMFSEKALTSVSALFEFQGITIAGIFGGLAAYGIGHVQVIAPYTPMNARFLEEDDRRKAVLRVQENITGIKNNEFKIHQFIETLLDLKYWILVLI